MHAAAPPKNEQPNEQTAAACGQSRSIAELDHPDLIAAAGEMDLVHKRADHQDAAAGDEFQIVRVAGIGKLIEIEAGTFSADREFSPGPAQLGTHMDHAILVRFD